MSAEKAFVKVTWHDAADNGQTWVQAEDIPQFNDELIEVISWGWLVGGSKTSKYITLAADWINDGVYGRVTKIPRKMITKIEEYEQ